MRETGACRAGQTALSEAAERLCDGGERHRGLFHGPGRALQLARRAVGFSMCAIDSGMLVATTCTLGTFFSPMWAASQILPSGPFLASTYWE